MESSKTLLLRQELINSSFYQSVGSFILAELSVKPLPKNNFFFSTLYDIPNASSDTFSCTLRCMFTDCSVAQMLVLYSLPKNPWDDQINKDKEKLSGTRTKKG